MTRTFVRIAVRVEQLSQLSGRDNLQIATCLGAANVTYLHHILLSEQPLRSTNIPICSIGATVFLNDIKPMSHGMGVVAHGQGGSGPQIPDMQDACLKVFGTYPAIARSMPAKSLRNMVARVVL